VTARGAAAGARCAALAGALLVVPARAGEVRLENQGDGVYAAGISFFCAFPARGQEPGEFILRYGDLPEMVWERGALNSVDAQVLVVNATPLRLPRIGVRVTLTLGQAALLAMPPPEELRPGGAGIVESLLFERTFSLDGVEAGSVGRVLVSDIQMAEIVKNLVRQKLWPAYLRAEAHLEGVPDEMKVAKPSASGLLRILLPAAAVTPATPAAPPAGSAPPTE